MADKPTGRCSLSVVESPTPVEIARTLMAEYAVLPHASRIWLSSAKDITALPEPYVPPSGVLLVALESNHPEVPATEHALGMVRCAASSHAMWRS